VQTRLRTLDLIGFPDPAHFTAEKTEANRDLLANSCISSLVDPTVYVSDDKHTLSTY
jgi:hypothetical protein